LSGHLPVTILSSVASPIPLVRAIGRGALTAVVINCVIGSGVFGLPATLAALTGSWSPLAVLIAGAGVFFIVLCFAEVGSRFDQAGGPYLYTREAFGPALGFHIGWLHIWTRILAAAAVLNVFVAYLAALLPWASTTTGRAVTMTAGMAVVTFVNVSGVRQAAWMVNAFTIAKLLPLMAVIVLGLANVDTTVLASQAVPDPQWTEAVLLLVFGYGGFESAVVAGSESRDPRRDTAFALLAGMLVVTAIYSLVQLSVVSVLPHAATNSASVSSALGIILGAPGVTLGSVAVIISVYGWLAGFGLMTPRILYAMGQRGELPYFLGRVHPRTRIPDAAIVVNSVLALALGLVSTFGQLATFSAISRLGILGTTCAALLALRRKWGPPQGFRAPAGTFCAVVGIAFCVWLLSTRSLAQAWFLPVVVVTGACVWRARRR
jgi:APA family basic amino acid/polyamine antiporter